MSDDVARFVASEDFLRFWACLGGVVVYAL